MEYWYRYRDDLWKKVIIFDHESNCIHHPRMKDDGEKRRENIRRAARNIEGYALCNSWSWFGTFTLNPAYRDRTDLDRFRKDFMRFIRNLRRSYGNIQALLVPELHKDKDGWHMHGLFDGVPVEALRAFTLKEKLPKYIRDKIEKGEPVYDWPAYRNAFGWVDMEPIRSRDAAARYITKYITKSGDATAASMELGKHLYYVTRGVALPERIETENAPGSVPEAFPAGLVMGNGYKFDYGEVQWYEKPRCHRHCKP